ncbi:MAG: polysaccharide deacetylase family protein [Clostridia bacterium]|nr:polysaccharide deacetylase family protein [Clostridia bacterium]
MKSKSKIALVTILIGIIFIQGICVWAALSQKPSEVKTASGNAVSQTVAEPVPTTAAPKIKLSSQELKIYCKDSAQLRTVIGYAAEWVSSDPETVSVDEKGNLTANKAGTVTIKAIDKNGNEAECSVISQKVAYLTIDDWPNKHTITMLETFKKYDVKATFFLAAQRTHHDIYKMIADEGHTVGNHSYSHNYESIYKNSTSLINSIDRQNAFLESVTGSKPAMVFRFPGGSTQGKCRAHGTTYPRLLKENGYQIFDWTTTSGDVSAKADADYCLNNIKKQCVRDREIILMHNKEHTAKAMPQIIEYLWSQGYEIAPITKVTASYCFVLDKK